mmetsp:Transcript_18377/g.22596  ORF Transcript_18377/g.22596 Transcript_18377/m.22596 type:complete len:235 (-) Transcript_18377:145-849(-)
MPYFFKSSDPNFTIYMGIDAEENDLLAKYGWPEDIFFHADKISSAHVYLRTKDNIDHDIFKSIKNWDDFYDKLLIPKIVIKECLQLCKYNSIQGCKQETCKIFLTPWTNISKIIGTDAGTIHVKKDKLKLIFDVKKKNKILKQINKTKNKLVVKENWFRKEKDKRDEFEMKKMKKLKMDKKKIAIENKKKAKKQKEAERKERELRDYNNIFDLSQATSNKNIGMTAEQYEESFM